MDREPPSLLDVRHRPEDGAIAGFSRAVEATIELIAIDAAPGSGLSRMRIARVGGDDAEDPQTQPFSPRAQVDLPDVGPHVFEVTVEDAAGHESASLELTITRDTSPPSLADPSLPDLGAAGPAITREALTSLRVNVDDDGPHLLYRVHDVASPPGPFLPAPDLRPFEVPIAIRPGPDGPRVLTGTARDAAGNERVLEPLTVTLDRHAASPAQIVVRTADGARLPDGGLVAAPEVHVDVELPDATERLVAILDGDAAVDGNAASCVIERGENGCTMLDVLLPIAAGGIQRVELSVTTHDEAGNTSTPATAALVVDLDPPEETELAVVEGPLVRHREVRLRLDVRGAAAYAIEGDVVTPLAFVVADRFPIEVPVVLSAGDGSKTIVARFRDEAGNTSRAAFATRLDQTAPTFDVALYQGGEPLEAESPEALPRIRDPQVEVRVALTSPEPHDCPATVDDCRIQQRVALSDSFEGAVWGPLATSWRLELPPISDVRRVRVELRDPAGNVSAPLDVAVELEVQLDREPPDSPGLRRHSLSADRIRLELTPPAAPDVAWFRVERSVPTIDGAAWRTVALHAASADDAQISADAPPLQWADCAGPADCLTYGAALAIAPLDPTTCDGASPGPCRPDVLIVEDRSVIPGHLHLYRARAIDDLGNASAPTAPIDAGVPIDPPTAQLVSGTGQRRLVWSVPEGTFSLTRVSTTAFDALGNPLPPEEHPVARGFLELPSAPSLGERARLEVANPDRSLVWATFVEGFGAAYREIDLDSAPARGLSAIAHPDGGVFLTEVVAALQLRQRRIAPPFDESPRDVVPALIAEIAEVFPMALALGRVVAVPAAAPDGRIWTLYGVPDLGLIGLLEPGEGEGRSIQLIEPELGPDLDVLLASGGRDFGPGRRFGAFDFAIDADGAAHVAIIENGQAEDEPGEDEPTASVYYGVFPPDAPEAFEYGFSQFTFGTNRHRLATLRPIDAAADDTRIRVFVRPGAATLVYRVDGVLRVQTLVDGEIDTNGDLPGAVPIDFDAAPTPGGGVDVTWITHEPEGTTLWAARVTDGEADAPARLVTCDAVRTPRIARNASGAARVIAWCDGGATSGLHYFGVDANGVRRMDGALVEAASPSAPLLVADLDDRFRIVLPTQRGLALVTPAPFDLAAAEPAVLAAGAARGAVVARRGAGGALHVLYDGPDGWQYRSSRGDAGPLPGAVDAEAPLLAVSPAGPVWIVGPSAAGGTAIRVDNDSPAVDLGAPGDTLLAADTDRHGALHAFAFRGSLPSAEFRLLHHVADADGDVRTDSITFTELLDAADVPIPLTPDLTLEAVPTGDGVELLIWIHNRVLRLTFGTDGSLSIQTDIIGSTVDHAAIGTPSGDVIVAGIDHRGTIWKGPFGERKSTVVEHAGSGDRVALAAAPDGGAFAIYGTHRTVLRDDEPELAFVISIAGGAAGGAVATVELAQPAPSEVPHLFATGDRGRVDVFFPDGADGDVRHLSIRPSLPLDVSWSRVDRSPRLGIVGDADGDRIPDALDNCARIWNPLQDIVGADGCCPPDRTGPACDRCSDPRRTGADCDVCAPGVSGLQCDECEDPHHTGPSCRYCTPRRTGPGCEICRFRFDGEDCERCADGYIGPDCNDCANPRYAGDRCDVCAPRFAGPDCGQCTDRFAGPDCDTCAELFAGPDCTECADPKFIGDSCDRCTDSRLAPPDCEQCRPGLGGPDCSEVVGCDNACDTLAACAASDDWCPGYGVDDTDAVVALCLFPCSLAIQSGIDLETMECEEGIELLRMASPEFASQCQD